MVDRSEREQAPRLRRSWALVLFKERVGAALAALLSLGVLLTLAVPALASRGHPLAAKITLGAFVVLLAAYVVGYLGFHLFMK